MTIPKKYTELHTRLSEIHSVLNAVVPLKNEYGVSVFDRAEQDIDHAEMELMELNRTMTAIETAEIFGDADIFRAGLHETCQGLYSITFSNDIIVEFTNQQDMNTFIVKWAIVK